MDPTVKLLTLIKYVWFGFTANHHGLTITINQAFNHTLWPLHVFHPSPSPSPTATESQLDTSQSSPNAPSYFAYDSNLPQRVLPIWNAPYGPTHDTNNYSSDCIKSKVSIFRFSWKFLIFFLFFILTLRNLVRKHSLCLVWC